MSEQNSIANPAPLGLMGFGMTTVLLNIHNAGFYEMNFMILGMGMFFGGIAQIIAGIFEFKKNNTFGATAFTAYGSFWLTLVVIVLTRNTAANAMGFFLAMWGVFSAFMFVATLKQSVANRIIFGTLVILFALLAIGDFTGSTLIKNIAGWEGIVCGFSAIYAACAQVLNEVYGKKVLPL